MISSQDMEIINNIEMNENRFISLLSKLIGETFYLQNSPAQGMIPQETRAARHVMEVLEPYSTRNGGVLDINLVENVEDRGNLIIRYPGETNKIISFVGSHFDVVPADPKGWHKNPFELGREGDLLYGRGTTDCLGHVALLTDFFATLAEKRPRLQTTVVAVFIANEENGKFKGIGIDQLSRDHLLDDLKNGPVYWIDAADSQPCIGTCGNMQWKLEVFGKLFHSGMPHKTVNSIEMGMDVMTLVQKRFYEDFPQDPREIEYNCLTCSTLKPTQISCSAGSFNQIPPVCTIIGDVRLTPFYDVANVKIAIESYVAEINENPTIIEGKRGPHSKYVVAADDVRGKVVLSWENEPENGIACNIQSSGFVALRNATEKVLGIASPYSIGGSLPLVRELQDEGFDIHIAGYGFISRYHADNECADINNLKNGIKIFAKILAHFEGLSD